MLKDKVTSADQLRWYLHRCWSERSGLEHAYPLKLYERRQTDGSH